MTTKIRGKGFRGSLRSQNWETNSGAHGFRQMGKLLELLTAACLKWFVDLCFIVQVEKKGWV